MYSVVPQKVKVLQLGFTFFESPKSTSLTLPSQLSYIIFQGFRSRYMQLALWHYLISYSICRLTFRHSYTQISPLYSIYQYRLQPFANSLTIIIWLALVRQPTNQILQGLRISLRAMIQLTIWLSKLWRSTVFLLIILAASSLPQILVFLGKALYIFPKDPSPILNQSLKSLY